MKILKEKMYLVDASFFKKIEIKNMLLYTQNRILKKAGKK